jgi:phosphonopyruvate decarboxylase
MIEATSFLNAAAQIGIGFYTGVPCSFLTPLINRTASDPTLRYVGAASEGEAVAIAAGAWLAGRETAVMCQNSGLGNAVNPLTSLNAPFRIPTLLIVTWRGQPGLNDEPQHELMGRITQTLLDVIEVPHCRFPNDPDATGAVMREAHETMARTSLPFALVLERGDIRDETLDEPSRSPLAPGRRVDLREGGGRPTRLSLLDAVLAAIPDDVPIVATTGKAGRELFTLADREQHIYLVGSMGCASAMGLGVAMTSGRRTVVLDGDGAALMKLGSVATIGAYQPAGLLHVLLDNGVHDSTGGQKTVSPSVDFAAVALACGYRRAFTCDSVAGFVEAFRQAMAADGPVLVHALIRPGSLEKLGRPTIAPHEVAQRFRSFLARSGQPTGQAAG